MFNPISTPQNEACVLDVTPIYNNVHSKLNSIARTHACTHARRTQLHTVGHSCAQPHIRSQTLTPGPTRALRPLFARGSQGRAMCIVREHSLESITCLVHEPRLPHRFRSSFLPRSRAVPSSSSYCSTVPLFLRPVTCSDTIPEEEWRWNNRTDSPSRYRVRYL